MTPAGTIVIRTPGDVLDIVYSRRLRPRWDVLVGIVALGNFRVDANPVHEPAEYTPQPGTHLGAGDVLAQFRLPYAIRGIGDLATLSVLARIVEMRVGEDELHRRREGLARPDVGKDGEYSWLYRRHVTQANTGADFDFLVGRRGHAVPRRYL